MLALNTTSTWPTFSFIGIPGLEAAHMWISIPFCLLYLVALAASYMKILGTVMKLGIQDGNWKSLHTCACHLCTVLVFYLPLISLAVLHRYTQETSPILYTSMSNAYLLMTPLLNPLVYSLKSRQIQTALRKRFGVQRVVAGE